MNLSAYAGKRVRLAFYHYATRSPDSRFVSESDGWYVDDIFLKRGNIAIASIADKTNSEGATNTFPVGVIGTTPASCLTYQLVNPPAGAWIDPVSGVFTWQPDECQGPGTYNIQIYVVDSCNNEANDLGFVKVTVNEVNEPPWLLPAEGTAYVGQTNLIKLCTGDPDCPRNPLNYSVFAPVPAGLSIDPSTGIVRWAPTLADVGLHKLRVLLCDGGSPYYCVTNSLSIGVTTNTPTSLEIANAQESGFKFTLVDGLAGLEYTLQQTDDICGCPCQMWENTKVISPNVIPYTFDFAPTEVNQHPVRFFRMKQVIKPSGDLQKP